MSLKIKVNEHINENNIQLQFITEKDEIAPLIGYSKNLSFYEKNIAFV